MNVTDFPLWTDYPFRGAIPSCVEVRRGIHENGYEVTIFWWPDKQKHVAVRTDRMAEPQAEIPVILKNLGCDVFDEPEDEIEITPEMIEAADEAARLFESEDPREWEWCVVYRAMERVRRAREREQSESYEECEEQG